MSPDYFNERARCSFSHDGQDAHIGVTSKSYESRTLYFLCKHTLSFVQREWKRSIDFSHSIRELMSIPKFLLSSRLRNLRFRSKLLNEKRNHIYCISFLMLLKLQFSYNLSFKGFGSRPVVYSSLMFGGSVETSIEEFWKFLWVFNRLVLVVDSFAPGVWRFMGDVSHFFQSTRKCISNANRLQVSSVHIDTDTTHARKKHFSKEEHNQQGTFKLFHIDSTKQKHMYMMLRFSFTLCSNIIINLLCLGVLMLIKISLKFYPITLLWQHGRRNVFFVVVVI